MASTEAKRKGHRRFEPANSKGGTARFRNRLADWGIPEAIVEDFAQHHTLLNFNKAAVIFSQYSPCDFLAWVDSGAVETAYQEVDGRRTLTRLVGPGDIFGHESFGASNGHPVHAFESRAHTDCQVALVSHERVVKALETLTPVAL